MVETILTTVLSSALYVTSAAFAPAATAPEVALTRVLPENSYVAYTVKDTDTLATISQRQYGSVDYWTTIWNDNTWITDPANIEAGMLLQIRSEKPSEPEVLTETTAAPTQDAVAVPTLTPVVTQAPPSVAASNNPGVISDEAVTYLGNCEAGNDPAKNTGNGYYGAFQFSPGTWNNLNTGYARADLAPIEVQRAAVKQLLGRSSIYNQFPGCANKMRSAGLI
ncbi:MAG: LysM peptidoglycan-binding domain-containing protein [Candidatus Levybacteria bacterium]|nr:LysM peptidoglycan-binding domain-containing protein [Candidatus Levybacteria bacterium]